MCDTGFTGIPPPVGGGGWGWAVFPPLWGGVMGLQMKRLLAMMLTITFFSFET